MADLLASHLDVDAVLGLLDGPPPPTTRTWLRQAYGCVYVAIARSEKRRISASRSQTNWL